ncbi:MAG: M28 family peptidase [Planctomycetes bacterium]|nr:M28 family peptidase [Planctomycetota bacterium]
MKRSGSLLFLATVLALPTAGRLAAQTPSLAESITEARVREVVSWLAADERHGRDTPSPGLAAAAEWLAQRFAAAGLEQVRKGSWFHDYTLTGQRLDSRQIEVVLHRKFEGDERRIDLEPDRDVRLWRAGDATSGELEPTTLAQMEDPVLRQLLRADSGRRPIVIEVAEDHPYWQNAAGERLVLARRRRAARPIFLVKDGLLPPPERPGAEIGWATTWSTPEPESVEIPLTNVVGLLPGTGKRDEYVVVSAHYDHIGVGDPVDGDPIFNGADDDASGTTAVVLIAEALAKLPAPQRSILFVCFSAEEKGLRGSQAFVLQPPVPREQIVADVNIEMIGRPAEGNREKAWITGRELSDFAAIAETAMGRAGIGIVDFPMARMLFAQSDNFSFVRQGIVAHSISAGSLHQDYHRPSDEVEKLDLPHMTQVIRGLAELVHELADRDAAPEWNEAGRARLEKIRK